MVASHSATWPTHTAKCYPEKVNDGYEFSIPCGFNGFCDSFWDDEQPSRKASETAPYSVSKAALDYYYDRTVIDDDNFGWPDSLEDDEYPIEMQCSYCFV